MRGKLRVSVEHEFRPDPEAVRRAITALLRFSDERRALLLVSPRAIQVGRSYHKGEPG